MFERLITERLDGVPARYWEYDNCNHGEARLNAIKALNAIEPGKNEQFWGTIIRLEMENGGLTERDMQIPFSSLYKMNALIELAKFNR